MATKKMTDGLNKQINAEFFASYLYLSMSAWLASEGFKGAAHWMELQAGEEHGHAMKIYNYMLERGYKITLTVIEGPETKWNSYTHIFEAALEHEKLVTAMINKLVADSRKDNDYATEIFLQWFVIEQVEEENSVNEVLDMLKLTGGDKANLLYVDRSLAGRTTEAATAGGKTYE